MASEQPELPIIPAPQHWQPAGGSLVVADLQRVLLTHGDGPWEDLGSQASRWLGPVIGHTPPVQFHGDVAPPAGSLLIRQVARSGAGTDTEAGAEFYRLEIRPDGVVLEAGEPAGAFRGLMTLVQASLQSPRGDVPCGVVTDEPRFPWRGMLLDCGRHFMPLPVIKEVLDALALHKFNVLHWHLTEDQGWRLEVPGLPRLTEVGAWRTGPDGQREGGWYSADDVREIVRYAEARHIRVVPEIEMPGHSVAVLAAYPGLSCTGGPFVVETQWGIHPDILCAGNDAVFEFLEKVLLQVMDLFPGQYIHVGGDEAPHERWRACPRCQQRMREEGLANESELQSWFVRRIERFLADHDRRLIGWDEILDGSLLDESPDAVVQSWRGTHGAIAAARAGHDAIVSPTSHAYFDYDPGVLDVLQVHGFDPVPAELPAEFSRHILGGEMNLWTEYLTPAKVPRMTAPRMAAMAEALWTGTAGRPFAPFLARLQDHGPVWEYLNWKPGAAARPVTITAQYDPDDRAHHLEFRLDPRFVAALPGADLVIRQRSLSAADYSGYAADTWPELQIADVVGRGSPTAPELLDLTFQPGDPAVLQVAQVFLANRPFGAPAVLELDPHLALGATVKMAHAASSRYPAGGRGWLVDGQHGGPAHGDGRWAGFEGGNLDAVIDLGRPRPLTQLSVRFLQDANAWIFLPVDVVFAWSPDGTVWHELPAVGHDVPDREQRRTIREFRVGAAGITARHIRVRARNPGTCPDWHPGRGQPCWIFADELVVR